MLKTIGQTLNRGFFPTICVLLILSGAIFLYISLTPIHVLKDWKISVPDKDYTPGSTIILSSSSVKVRQATANATRYIQCGNVRYPLNQSTGHRKPGARKSKLEVKIPSDIAGLPAKCQIGIDAVYKVYNFRQIKEHTMSNYFRIVPPSATKAPDATATVTALPVSSPASITGSSTSLPVTKNPSPSSASNSAPAPTPPASQPPQPSPPLLQQVLGGAVNIIQRVL